MTFKTTRSVAMLLALFAAASVSGQGESPTDAQNPELENARALLQAGREQIIREDLQLTDAEASGFWPVYEEYIAALAVVRDRKANLIAGFLKAYREGEFTEEHAANLIAENFGVKEAWLDVQLDFVARFGEVLPTVKVARFYQLENKMDAEVDAQLALVIPLVE